MQRGHAGAVEAGLERVVLTVVVRGDVDPEKLKLLVIEPVPDAQSKAWGALRESQPRSGCLAVKDRRVGITIRPARETPVEVLKLAVNRLGVLAEFLKRYIPRWRPAWRVSWFVFAADYVHPNRCARAALSA